MDGYLKQEIVSHQQQSFETSVAYLRLGPKAHMALSSQSNKFMNPIELTIRTEQSNITNDEKRKQQTPVEQLNERCLNEIKQELKSIFGNNSHSMIIPDRAIKEMVKLMPYVFHDVKFKFHLYKFYFVFSRTKEAMIKDVNEITEERYKRYELHRLLSITQRFGVELDEIRRQEAVARRALSTTATSSSKRKFQTSDDEEDIDFSVNDDGFIKIHKQKNKNNGHHSRFVKRKKKPASFYARRNAIAKRKRGGF